MSLHAPVVYIIPADTARVARQAFPKGNPYLLIADELGPLYANAQFAALFSQTGQPGIDPARLALITVFHSWKVCPMPKRRTRCVVGLIGSTRSPSN